MMRLLPMRLLRISGAPAAGRADIHTESESGKIAAAAQASDSRVGTCRDSGFGESDDEAMRVVPHPEFGGSGLRGLRALYTYSFRPQARNKITKESTLLALLRRKTARRKSSSDLKRETMS